MQCSHHGHRGHLEPLRNPDHPRQLQPDGRQRNDVWGGVVAGGKEAEAFDWVVGYNEGDLAPLCVHDVPCPPSPLFPPSGP